MRVDRVSPTYWRVQDAGFPLSRSHRSETHGEDDDDPLVHPGTSAVDELSDLGKVGPNLRMWGDDPEVEIVEFEGEPTSEFGWDGEPIVIPTREIRRFRKKVGKFGKFLNLQSLKRVSDLRKNGWTRVATLGVAN